MEQALLRLLLGLLATLASMSAAKPNKCTLCSDIVGEFFNVGELCPTDPIPTDPSFRQGLRKTEGRGFGGGNTDWEERVLGDYKTSESRFGHPFPRLRALAVCPSLHVTCIWLVVAAPHFTSPATVQELPVSFNPSLESPFTFLSGYLFIYLFFFLSLFVGATQAAGDHGRAVPGAPHGLPWRAGGRGGAA
jgi:hypothetical protein